MKKLVNHSFALLFLFCIVLMGCDENTQDNVPDEIETSGSLNLLAARVGTANTEIVNINLSNGEQFSFTTECMVLSSRVFDQATQSIGYTTCDNTFKMVNPTTGELINTYELPGPISMAVINDASHTLIGTYYNHTEEVNHVIRLNLDNGELLSNLAVEALGPMYTCTQFFDQGNQTFSLISSDNDIVTIDAVNGTVMSRVAINAGTNVIHYKESSQTLIAITYERDTNTNYVELSNVMTGELTQRVAVQGQSNFRLCVSGFDTATNSLVTVNSENQIRYINIETGEIIEHTQLDPALTPVSIYAQ